MTSVIDEDEIVPVDTAVRGEGSDSTRDRLGCGSLVQKHVNVGGPKRLFEPGFDVLAVVHATAEIAHASALVLVDTD